MLMWAGTDEWRAEAADVQVGEGRFRATGVQLGIVPVPYRVDYVLDTAAGWVTSRLQVTADGDGWHRSLLLTRDPYGRWSSQTNGAGQVDLPMPGGGTDELNDALDCDLGLSPLSNSMPILRHRLQEHAGAVDCTMAWVAVPDLTVHRSVQRYEHLRSTPVGALIRFTSGDFTADLLVDAAGFVVDYPQLASRVPGR
jgi:hypothetical protein